MFLVRARTSAASMGFDRTSLAPRSSASTRTAPSPLAVIIMMGISAA